MEIILDNGLLGEYDYHEESFGSMDLEKPKVMKDLGEILGGIGSSIAIGFVLFFFILTLGSCMGCKSCVSCLNSCTCFFECGTACSECGEKMSCDKACGSTKSKSIKIVYEDGKTKELTYKETKKRLFE